MEENLNNTSVSIYNIFVFFLIISSNYLGALFPCRIQRVLNENVYLKHIFGFLTLNFFVVLTDPYKKKDLMLIFKESLILYIIFIIFIANNYHTFLTGLFIIGIIYILNLKKVEYEEFIKINKDNNEQIIQIENYNRSLNYIKMINNILFYLFIIVIVIGCILYMGEKKIEYKDKFNYITFIFGQSSCKNKSPTTNALQSLKAVFQ